MTEAPLGGVLLLDKPTGISSFQALRPVKRLFPKTKIGHAGTLDPMASGLLLVGVGSATRLLEYLEGMTKTYSFEARFGFTSDTYDMEGVLEPHPGASRAGALSAADIERALGPFRGRIRQVPPAYSAIKVDGERAYDRARAGETVTLEAREVEVLSLELKSFAPRGTDASAATSGAAGNTQVTCAPCAVFETTCSKGTYVRSLVHDLGQALGCGAVTDKIRRLAIGPFAVANACAPDALSAQALLPLEVAVAHLPAAVVPQERTAAFLNGQAVRPTAFTAAAADLPAAPTSDGAGSETAADIEYRALDATGRLLAIATLSPQGVLCPRKVLAKA